VTRWLVTGAGGQLGADLLRVLAAASAQVTGRTHQELDIADRCALADAVRGVDVVVNAAGWTDVDGAESAEVAAHAANATAPGLVAQACAAAGATMIHLSTDYVFSGDATTPYREENPTRPRSAYGRSKAAGERAVLASGARAYVVRAAWLYGQTGHNFVRTMARLERERDTVDVVADQHGSPTWSRDLAAGLVALGESGVSPGVYHCTNAGDTTWFGLARAVFSELGADPDRIHPTTTDRYPRPAPRPAYSVLSAVKWQAAGLPALRPWRAALIEAFRVGGEGLRG